MNVKLKHDDYTIISFKNNEYKINTRKLEAVFSLLENKNVVIKSYKQLSELLNKYKLYDKDFLENVNNL